MHGALSFACAALVLSAAGMVDAPPQEVISLLGRPLVPAAIAPKDKARMQIQLADALATWRKDPDDADALIWAGRRFAYLSNYDEAVKIFSQGIAQHPDDARMYRHRGHRYLTIRQIDRAIADFEQASRLIEGQPDEVEPDGLPNARNIPTGTLHSNIYYHLALGYYLKQDFGRAAEFWARARDSVANADNLVAASYWLYLALRRAGRDADAAALLPPITADLDVIENTEYHQLLLLFKGERTPESLLAAAGEDAGGSATRYGIGAWHWVNGRNGEAAALWKSILERPDWPSFGHLAAEAEAARDFEPER